VRPAPRPAGGRTKSRVPVAQRNGRQKQNPAYTCRAPSLFCFFRMVTGLRTPHQCSPKSEKSGIASVPTPELNILREISSVLRRTADPKSALEKSLDILAHRLDVDACGIFTYDTASHELQPSAWSSGEPPPEGFRLPAEVGLAGCTFRRQEITHAADVSTHPHRHEREAKWISAYHSCVMAPLTAGGRTIGVMYIASRRPRRFDERTIALAEAVATPFAIVAATQNAERRAERKQRAERRAAAQEKAERSPVVLRGRPVCGGVVCGRVFPLAGVDVLQRIAPEYTDDPDQEMALFERALVLAREEAEKLQQEAAELLPEADAAIFLTHLLLLDDPSLHERISDAISRGFSLRFALHLTARTIEQEMAGADDAFVRERVADLKDVIVRLLDALERTKEGSDAPRSISPADLPANPIAVTAELLPSQMIRLPLGRLAGVVCERGGETTHVAILARALNIPMIVGVPGVTHHVRTGDAMIMDASTGICYLRPNEEIRRRFQPVMLFGRRGRIRTSDTEETKTTPRSCPVCRTADGTDVRLAANISLITELPLLQRFGAMGIGLYRTEFMFLIRPTFPSEEEQYRIFRRVVEEAGDRRVTIRVLDVGGDKALPYVDFGREANAFLGWRGMRFLLDNPQYFRPHLRALLRTARHQGVNILLPMVASPEELDEILDVIADVKQELLAEGVVFDKPVDIGVMVEVPSALWGLRDILERVDFVSIGTNDLTQYTFAVDRGNQRVARWFKPLHPIMLRIIHQVCETARTMDRPRPVSLCGELAGSSLAVPFLLGAGLRILSMNPWRIPRVRKIVERVTMEECRQLLNRGMRARTAHELFEIARTFLTERNLGDDSSSDRRASVEDAPH